MLAYPRNLPGLAYSIVRRPKHAVSVQQHQSGGEVRMSYWSEPLWEYDLTYELLRDGFRNGQNYDELRQVIGLFLASTGSLQGFSVFDPDDNKVARQYIGATGNGVSNFDLVRTFGSYNAGDFYQGTEHVGLVDTTQPFNLYIDNSPTPVALSDPTYGYMLATGTPMKQQIAFNAAPPSGHSLFVDVSYLFYCRFQADTLDFEKFMHQLWALKKVTLCSIRYGSGSSSLPTSGNTPGRSVGVNISPLQMLNTDGYVGITNTSGAALVVQLPPAPFVGQTVLIKDEGGNALTYNWSIQLPVGGAVVDVVDTNGGWSKLRWNGASWFEVS